MLTIVGNNKIFSDTIQNYSANPCRRVDLTAQLNHRVNHNVAMKLLQERIARIPNVAADPPPCVEILEFNLAGPVLAVRPYCHTDHYWQVYFDSKRAIREAFVAAAFPAPDRHLVIHDDKENNHGETAVAAAPPLRTHA